ncbi:hypothetical protein OsJ_22142 [Oryza sativa Japonica Group]|uniref:Uncharacterized protein n=1 Tax=Oryza sativa subsp. japonica TaxID=39947 RepID=B9FQ66_ORYSJ|nr:hypothetical protein OsJ_22142 [Oryza sativa Japonica Group]
MEVERVAAAAGGVHGLQRAPGAMGGGTSSLLSAAVQEMLMVQKSNKAIKKPPRATPRLPPVTGERRGGSGGSVDRGEATAPAPKRAARAWQPPAKRVARSMLRRGAPPSPEEERKVLTCCCARLPPGATLRAAPVRSRPIVDAVALRRRRRHCRHQRGRGAPGVRARRVAVQRVRPVAQERVDAEPEQGQHHSYRSLVLARLQRDSACAVAMSARAAIAADGVTTFNLMLANVMVFEALATKQWRYRVTIELYVLMLYNNG